MTPPGPLGPDLYKRKGSGGVSSPEPLPSRGCNTRQLCGRAVLEAAGGVRPKSTPQGAHCTQRGWITPLSGESGSQQAPAFSKEPSTSLPGPVSGYKWGPKADSLHPSPNRGFPAGVGRGRRRNGGLQGAPHARASPGRIGYPDLALQGTLHRPGSAQARAPRSPRPSRRVPFLQRCEGAACPPPAHRPPHLPGLRAAPWPAPERLPCSQSASPS